MVIELGMQNKNEPFRLGYQFFLPCCSKKTWGIREPNKAVERIPFRILTVGKVLGDDPQESMQ